MTPISLYVEVARVSWPSLLTGAAVGISGSLLGVLVLLRREALMALAMPQVVAVGAAAGLRLGWPSLPPALGAVVVAVLLLVWSKRHGAGHWVLPSLYIGGLSLSFLIIAHAGAHVAELQSMFTGIDVAVYPSDALLATPILLAAGITCALLWRRWLLLSQSPSSAEAAGINPRRWDALFLVLLATVLLIGTDALGTVMVIAMLFLPGAAVLPWARRVPQALFAAAVLSLVLLVCGFVLSVEFELPLSQSVGGAGFGALILLHGLARALR
jgi:ABC-type Mn2+/Zn2+ transport system permease subunit